MLLRCLAGLMSLMLMGCSVGLTLAPPPNLYRTGQNYPEQNVAPALRTAAPKIFFVTDRARSGDSYNSDRSDAMVFGQATVRFGENLEWRELLRRTRADSEKKISTLWVQDIDELVRFPRTPLPFQRINDRLQALPDAQAQYDTQTRAFQAGLRAQLRAAETGRVLIYIHGYNNRFEDSISALANIWHFAGRRSVPIAFTWPSGNGFGLLGYFRDRDSGMFSVFHTKEFLRMLSRMPEVKNIDIIAHSQGSAVATTALRELVIEHRAAGRNPRKAMKTRSLIMAAPDLDAGIVQQRLQAERFSDGFHQINLYINPDDIALRVSRLITGQERIGAVNPEDFPAGDLAVLQSQAQVHLIRVENVRAVSGHSYFRQNPAVLSDIALTLRTGARPGEDGRPLEPGPSGMWVLHENYPLQRLKEIGFVLGQTR